MINDCKLLFGITTIFSGVLLGGAYFIEYIFNTPPCHLCHYQRLAHWFVMFISIVGLCLKNRVRIFLAVLVVVSYLISSIIAFIHVGVENNWFKISSSCTTNISLENITNSEQLKEHILGNDNVPCDYNSFELFYISLAGWNFIFSLVIFIFSAIYIFIIFTVKYDHKTEKLTWRFKNHPVN